MPTCNPSSTSWQQNQLKKVYTNLADKPAVIISHGDRHCSGSTFHSYSHNLHKLSSNHDDNKILINFFILVKTSVLTITDFIVIHNAMG